MYRKTYLEVDTTILENNVREIATKYSDYKYFIGVVKSNAYGHGFYVVNSLIKGGINYIAVSSLEEAIEVRKYNKDISVLVLEPVSLEYINVIIENNITITVSNFLYFEELNKMNLNSIIKFHLKINTGMNRLGIDNKQEILAICNNNNANLLLEGIYTHYATSGINDKYYDMQTEKFKELLSEVDLSKVKIIHAGRSASLCHPKVDICNGIRLGIIMYGINTNVNFGGFKGKLREYKNKVKNISPTNSTNLNIKSSIKLISSVIEVRKIKKGDIVGYGALYKALQDETIAIIPIGYGDGINAGNKHVSINERIYPLLGIPCMDMIIARVDENVKVNDKVVIIGDEIDFMSVCSGINPYKVFTSITNRVPRVYSLNNEKIEIKY